ncbi:MAG: pilus assembly protein N-terminal domain-containing protein [Planctomycetota bacterium]|nr:pilus assembly protein N-terminal domain-containing protein [Planctomycetota bacterium]MDA1165994.1 pilus assembly protein N-terminal domain-containing protein [Planctomycetota bacterium]
MPSKSTIRRQLLTLASWASVAGAGLLPAFAQPGPVTDPTPVPTAAPTARELARAAALDPVFTITGSRSEVEIVERLSKVLELGKKITRVDGFDPAVLDVKALTPYRVRVQALTQGVTNLVLTDEDDLSYVVNVFIKGDARHLQAVLDNRFPDSAVEAYRVQDSVALTGWVSQPEHITQIVEIAEQFYPQVLNQMHVGGVQQVMLKVKIMEVQRTKLRRMGFDFINTTSGGGFIRSSPGQLFALADDAILDSVTSSATAFGVVGSGNAFFGFFDALKEEKLLKILSEPSLLATNGRPATLLSGGEFPILLQQTFGTTTVQWRKFGVELEAVPIILGDGRVRLEIMPSFTERDLANSSTLNGTTVPALTTRKINTQAELRFGQTLMLAGLISSRQTAETSKIPFLGELPWIGAAFRKVKYDDVETELVILITPELVSPMSADQVPRGGPGTFTTFPTDRELYFDGYIEVPNYGDGCAGCGGIGGCEAGCQASLGGPGVSRAFQVPVTEQTTPLPQANSNRGLQELMADQNSRSSNNRLIEPSADGRTASRIPSNGASGRTQPAGYIRPSLATGSSAKSQARQPASNQTNSDTASTRSSQLPGLIEP